jgi:hypothetical protein
VRSAGAGSAVPGEAGGAAVKACVDCRHHVELAPAIHLCFAPQLGVDPVTGTVAKQSAHFTRSHGACARDGAWFEEKVVRVKPPSLWQKIRFW